jgi:hypothetical protein
LREPRFGLAVVIGAVAGTPGASYVTALHQLVTSKSSTAVQAAAVVVFALIEFSLVIIPFVFLVFRPEGTKAQLQRAQAWLMGHARQLLAAVAVVAGGYMVVSGLVLPLGDLRSAAGLAGGRPPSGAACCWPGSRSPPAIITRAGTPGAAART